MRILLAMDGSEDARAATESLAELPLPEPTTLRRHGRRIVDEARALLSPRLGVRC